METELTRPKPTYTIKTSFGTLETSASPDRYFNVVQAFDFAAEESKLTGLPMRLQTIGDALQARLAFHNDVMAHPAIFDTDEKKEAGLNRSQEYQKTCTVSLGFRNNGSFGISGSYVRAFVDLPVDKKSKDLVQRRQFIPITDTRICDLVAQAKETRRMASAQAVRELVLKTKKEKGESEYGQHKTPIAIFGSAELAELNASYLNEARNKGFGRILDYTAQELEMLGEDNVLVSAVDLGGDDYGIVNAGGGFDGGGRARSVVHGAQKISPVEIKVAL